MMDCKKAIKSQEVALNGCIPVFLQCSHHRRYDVLDCFNVDSESDCNVVGMTLSGIFFIAKACLRACMPTG
nr:unnamed protein product [Callosobruchus analis]